MFRQSLIGANYGLLDEKSLQLRPDFYASFLWKRLMGPAVFKPQVIEGSSSKLRLYVHRNEEMNISILLINIDTYHEGTIHIHFDADRPMGSVDQYLLQGREGPMSSALLLNGVLLEEDLILKWGKKKNKRKI